MRERGDERADRVKTFFLVEWHLKTLESVFEKFFRLLVPTIFGKITFQVPP